MPKRDRSDWWLWGGVAALSATLVYLCTTDTEVRLMLHLSRACQATARLFGQWGLDAERYYHTLLERERMV